MTNTMQVALQAALDFHNRQGSANDDAVIATARKFYSELFMAAPSGVDEYNEEWFNQLHAWLQVLNGDQLGAVKDTAYRIVAERNSPLTPAAQSFQKAYGPVGRMQMASIPLTQTTREERAAGHGQVHAIPPGVWTRLPGVTGSVFHETGSTLGVMIASDGTVDLTAPMKWRPETPAINTGPGVDVRNLGQVEQTLGTVDSRSKTLLPGDTLHVPSGQRVDLLGGTPSTGPVLKPGDEIRIRPLGADPFTTATVVAKVDHNNSEGFRAFVPPGAFSEAAKRELGQESVDSLLKALEPAGLRGTVIQQIKELVGTAERRLQALEHTQSKHQDFENRIRAIVQASDGNDDWDNPCPEQPTIDAVLRVVHRLCKVDKHKDGSLRSRAEVLDRAQRGWHKDGHKELQG